MFTNIFAVLRGITSPNEETKEKLIYPTMSDSMNITPDSYDSELWDDDPASSEDGLFEDIQKFSENTSPPHANQNRLELENAHDRCGPCLSNCHKCTRNQTAVEEREDPHNLPEQNATSTKSTQCSSIEMKSVYIQCEPRDLVTQGVQCELLTLTQSVQCELPSQIEQAVQCDPLSQTEQAVQCDQIVQVTQGIQYETPCMMQKLGESQKKYTKYQSSKSKVSCLTEEWGSHISAEVQQVSSYQCEKPDPIITLPAMQKELNIVTSSQTTVCMSSQSSCDASENIEVVVIDEVQDQSRVSCDTTKFPNEDCPDSESDVIPSSSAAPSKRNQNNNKLSDKHTETCRSRQNTRDKNASDDDHSKKLDEEYTAEELLLEMGTSNNSFMNKHASRSKHAQNMNNRYKKILFTKQKMLDSYSQPKTSSDVSKQDAKSDGDSSAEELCLRVESSNTSEEEDRYSNKSKKSKRNGNKKKEQIAPQTSLGPSEQPETQGEPSAEVILDDELPLQQWVERFRKRSVRRDSSGEVHKKVKSNETELKQRIVSQKAPKASLSSQETERASSGEESSDGDELPQQKARNRYFRRRSVRRDSNREKQKEIKSNEFNKKRRIDHHKVPKVSFRPQEILRNTPPSQRTPTQQWFSSMTCERSSSPECFDENTVEEMRNTSSFCQRKLIKQLQMKDTSCLEDKSVSVDNIFHSTPTSSKQMRVSAEVSSHGQEQVKRKKVSANAKDINVTNQALLPSSKLVPYSDSDDSEDSYSTFQEISRRKEQNHNRCEQVENSCSKRFSIELRRTASNNVALTEKSRNVPSNKSTSSSSNSIDSTISYSIAESCRVNKSPRWRAPYSKLEKQNILYYIIDHKYFKLVKGRAMWERMENEEVCRGRTWQSMKEHFIKKILPRIESFHLEPECTKKFISIRKK